jgi:hypothetical protein
VQFLKLVFRAGQIDSIELIARAAQGVLPKELEQTRPVAPVVPVRFNEKDKMFDCAHVNASIE